MFCADLIGLAAHKPADGTFGAADAGRQLCLGNFMFLHKLLHPHGGDAVHCQSDRARPHPASCVQGDAPVD